MRQELRLYGVAVADGTVRWRQAASPGHVASGIPLTTAMLEQRVAYFRPDPSANLAVRLVVASTDTGDDLLVSAPGQFVPHPSSCGDHKDVCVRLVGNDRVISRRFSAEARAPGPDPGAAPPDSRSVGEGLLDLGPRDPEMLAGFEGGTVRWRSPLSLHFSPAHSTDRDWHFELYRTAASTSARSGARPIAESRRRTSSI